MQSGAREKIWFAFVCSGLHEGKNIGEKNVN
jgi:hypothetical protein